MTRFLTGRLNTCKTPLQEWALANHLKFSLRCPSLLPSIHIAVIRPEQILAGELVYKKALGEAFTFENAGARSLKGFTDPVSVFAVEWRSAGESA